ncbi:MAG: helix-turn-helix domain-containing protein [Candidatus Cybelea sp.]
MEDRGHEAAADFGTLLRQYRLAAGLSQEALAERARVSSEGISALERGYRRTPQRETLALLADALALDLEQRAIFEAAARPVASRRQSGASITVGPWPEAGTFPLPIALTSFIGRTTDVTEIAALLREHRLVTLTGAGGIGKTQTALRVGSAFAESGELSICFVPFAPVADPSSAVATIATALSVQEVPQRSRLEMLIAFLKNKLVLLILDGCECLIDEVARASQALLTGTTALRILATSREPLRAAGEYAYRLPALPEADAVALFTDRAVAVNHRFTLSDENGAIVAAICRQLDGIPLAIELAAGRMNVLSVKALAERLSDEQSQTMRQSVESSYNLLSEPQRQVFERLSTFDKGATLDETTAACEPDGVAGSDILGLIASLVDKSLVVAELETGEPRYRLLEASRQYAREKLSTRCS